MFPNVSECFELKLNEDLKIVAILLVCHQLHIVNVREILSIIADSSLDRLSELCSPKLGGQLWQSVTLKRVLTQSVVQKEPPAKQTVFGSIFSIIYERRHFVT